ncbi:MAG: serine/threonine-protein kinase [Candidatus Acidiferrum sp.]
MYCSSCGAQVSSTNRFCSSCGGSLDPNAAATIDSDELSSTQETIAPSAPPPRRTPTPPPSARPPRTPSNPSSRPPSSDPIGGGRFTPGEIIAERYRVVALAGRGGMGEVYRAEDLKLGQLVAIKFLPELLSQDAAALSRFHSEVRIARQVSHPNVCRVFDIGDSDGTPFLSMEYVDGEDLASVVRRIGRLSPDKASEVARQICAGLAAAHERGVIHRDLKPANVMLDGAGKIRITDFGLAGIAASIHGADIRAGTPAYMAPEQVAGKEVTAKSDIYSLGLILYEILTGKRAFEASTLPELIKLREQGTITNPSTLVRDLDPLIERVILRCLENDPAKRPASALQVAAALPGGDPLAAALAAGETPSPEMVAAAGAKEGMRPRLALVLLAIVALGLVASLLIAESTQLVNRVTLDSPPEVLATRAREIVGRLGLPADAAADAAYGFEINNGYLNYVQTHDKSRTRWETLANSGLPAMTFWYRQSPNPLFAQEFFGQGAIGGGQVYPGDPAMDTTAMVLVVLDTTGRLVRFEVVPPEKSAPPQNAKTPDWAGFFAASGLHIAEFREVVPEWAPLVPTDSRLAWTGTLPERGDVPIRVEAAAFHGEPVYYRMIFPWTRPGRDTETAMTRQQKIASALLVLMILTVFVVGVALARWNIKANRADMKGAARLGSFVFVTFLVLWILSSHHLQNFLEAINFLVAVASAALRTFFAMVLYVALEPFVRRREPQTLISWTRLLAGNLRDPLVGRDLLIGAVYGVLIFLVEASDNFLLPLFGKLPPIPGGVSTESLLGLRHALAQVLLYVLGQTIDSLGIFFMLFVLQRILRSAWIAAIVVALAGMLLSLGSNSGEYPWISAAFLVVLYLSFLLVLKRFGLLALLVGLVVQQVLLIFPATIHLSRWYAAPSLVGMTAIAALTIYGFRTALAGQPVFSMKAFEQ